MPRPSKPIEMIKTEKKSHRTKAEISTREQEEKALDSNDTFNERAETKSNKIAHKEFLRISKILKNIGKNDALYEGIINRYCLLTAECLEFEGKREYFYESMNVLGAEYQRGTIEPAEYFGTLATMQTSIINLDKQVMTKRKMLLDIEKENIMTIASALRSIPKKPKEEEVDTMSALLGSRSG